MSTLYPNPVHSRKALHGFTLIELLVVVTIIVVLLALLIPAMDKAIHQAELAQCGANLKAIGTGAALYAFDHKRSYPNRPGNREAEDTTSFAPFYLASRTDNNPLNRRDVRPIIKAHIGPKLWNCPLAGDIDLSEEATEGSDRVYGGYNLFFGFTYTRPGGVWLGAKSPEKGMMKMGDRWSFTNTDGNSNPVTHRFNLLATDIDYNQGSRYSFGSHPDAAGFMANKVSQGDLSGWAPDGTVTWTWWEKPKNSDWRGDIDFNAARDDGSVVRYAKVLPNKFEDPRFTDVALFDTRFGYDGDWLNVPKQ